MVCPICHQAMRQEQNDTTKDGTGKKIYNRTVYQCMGDDVWLTLEIPKDHPSENFKYSDKVVVD